MKLNSMARLFVICLFLFSISACKKEKIDNAKGNGQIEFSLKSVNNSLKSTSGGLAAVAKAIITIESSEGEATDYNYKEISIYKMNEEYFTQKIALKTGSYKLTEFFLLDETGNTIYVCPKSGSAQAQNVSRPLSINFDIEKDKSVSVEIEVISTKDLNPADFGLVWFPISEVETFPFLISVSEKGSNTLLPAKIQISADNYVYYQDLTKIVTNVVKVKSGYDQYTIIVSFPGYKTYEINLTKEELESFKDTPLVIELDKDDGPILKMLFDGNIEDATGNVNSDQIFSSSVEFVSDRFGNAASAILVTPYNSSHITIYSNIYQAKEYTYSAWYKANELPYYNELQSIINVGGGGGSQSLNICNRYFQFHGATISSYVSETETFSTSVGELFETEVWYNLTFVRTQSSLKLYINGELIINRNGEPQDPYYTADMLKIGCRWNDTQFVNGVIDDVIIYNRALSAEEIVKLYHAE